MQQSKVIFYVHGITTGEDLCEALESRDDVVNAQPLDIVDNPDPRLPERNEAIVITYNSEATSPTALESFVEQLGYKVVAHEAGPAADRL
jgi:hypothetical protein